MTPLSRRLLRGCAMSVLGLLCFTLLALALASALLSTAAGSRRLLDIIAGQVNQLPGYRLEIGRSEGALLQGIEVQDLLFSTPAVSVAVAAARLGWNPYSLLSRRFYAADLEANGVRIELPAPAGEGSRQARPDSLDMALAPLPLALQLERITLRDVVVSRGTVHYAVDSFALGMALEGMDLVATGLAFRAGPLSVVGDLAISLQQDLPLTAALDWRYDSPLTETIQALAGSARLSGDITRIELDHQLQEPIRIHSGGRVTTGITGPGYNLDLEHEAASLTLPFPQASGFNFENPRLSTQGRWGELALSLVTGLSGEGIPALQAELSGTLLASGLLLDSALLTAGDGRLSASGNLQWADTLTGRLAYYLEDPDPADNLRIELPLTLSDLSSRGEVQFDFQDGAAVRFDLQSLRANLGDYPLEAAGNLLLDRSGLVIDEARASTRDNRIAVSGSLGETLDLGWEIDAPQLEQFLAELSGRLVGRGELTGTRNAPVASARILLEGLAFQATSVQTANLQASLAGGSVTAVLDATGLVHPALGGTPLEHLEVSLSGTESSHRLQFASEATYGAAELVLQGGIIDRSALEWQGSLFSGELDTPIGTWRNAFPAPLQIRGLEISLRDDCWTHDNAAICLDVSPQAGGLPLVELQLANYPLTLFNHPGVAPAARPDSLSTLPHLAENATLAGVADGNLRVRFNDNGQPDLDFSLVTRDTSLALRPAASGGEAEPESEAPGQQLFSFSGTRLDGSLVRGDWNLDAGLRVRQESIADSDLDAEGSISGSLAILAGTDLDGEVRFSLDELGWISGFVADLSAVTGDVGGQLTIGGTLASPRLLADITLGEAGLDIDPLGISLTGINGWLSSPDHDSMSIFLSGSSGGGSLEIAGRIRDPYSAGRTLEASIRGAGFQLARVPELELDVSPDMQVLATMESIQVSGALAIPHLALVLAELPQSAVDVSRDAVVVAYPPDQPQLARSIAADQSTLFNIPVVADVDISLLDDVTFRGFGMRAEVAGELNIQQHANGTNLTYGELTIVEGDYSLYGQTLLLRSGKLLFFGAADNPALDVRAVREIPGVTVGVLMNGTLKNLNSQLFSTPALQESDIIAILVTGKPFSETTEQDGNAMIGAVASLGISRSRGLTNQIRDRLGLDTLAIENSGNLDTSILAIGKYLTPDIFVRYGVGLFDRQSKLAIDYSLSERITLQAETGEYQSVDLTYKVEK